MELPRPASQILPAFIFAALFIGALFATRSFDFHSAIFSFSSFEVKEKNFTTIVDFPLRCSINRSSEICPKNYYPSEKQIYRENENSPTCPEYFRWIYEDLSPWRATGISKEMVAEASMIAHFRLTIIAGKMYIRIYKKAFQTRDDFTIWGILQLLRKYPGEIPDLDLVFECEDRPVIGKRNDGAPPPPVFRYCGDGEAANIVFPDWSFWGWPEVNIKPWGTLVDELKEANERVWWSEREPYAYWKGNPRTGAKSSRADLMKCNVTQEHDWGARLYAQDWVKEFGAGFNGSNLTDQCVHRYKIYIEGNAWSVSEKYILACNSPTLFVKSRYFDFFTRSLKPLKHYWPVNNNGKCRSIKFAVEWGNNHQKEAQAIGKAGSRFVLDELRMDHVYDYMLHSLKEYAKLLNYKPEVPEGAVEVCSESIACLAQGLMGKFLVDSLVKHPHLSRPCTMPPPYSPSSFHSTIKSKEKGEKQVRIWEEEYWKTHGMKTN